MRNMDNKHTNMECECGQRLLETREKLETEAFEQEMRKRLVEFFFREILAQFFTKLVWVEIIGHVDDDERHEMFCGLQKESALGGVVDDPECVEVSIGVEGVIDADAIFLDLDLHEIRSASCDKDERTGRNDRECDQDEVIHHELDDHQCSSDDDHRGIPVIVLFRV